MCKDYLRPIVTPLPQWAPIALTAPQGAVTATLDWREETSDVTAGHTVASLKPLTLAMGFDAGERPRLAYRDTSTGALLGRLRLARNDTITAAGGCIALYRIDNGQHHCLGWPRRACNTWLQNRAARRAPHHGLMTPEAVQQLMIAYLIPRPVVLVSVASADHVNIFPMDLIGPLQPTGLFSLALRSTNVSMPIMREAGKVVLSSMPATMKDAVYKLAAHHKQPLQDWSALPFPTRPSPTFGIPFVGAALRVRELSIEHSQNIGSHHFFVCRPVSDQSLAEHEQLHHTAGVHQAWRRKRGEAFTPI